MTYTKEQIEKAKETIIQGIYEGKSLKSILDEDKLQDEGRTIPDRSIVYTWLNENHENYDAIFFNNYAHAREDSSDLDADRIEDLNAEIRSKKIDPQSARVIADNLKWIAGKKKPKKYGDRTSLDLSGELKQTKEITLTDDQLQKIIDEIKP